MQLDLIFETAAYPALLALVVALLVVAAREVWANAQRRPALARQVSRRRRGAASQAHFHNDSV